MTYLSVENLSKSFGEKFLFENITFGLSKGDKTALVAPNGTGKSTLLKIIAGEESQDSGEVMTQNDIRIGYLMQEPRLDPEMTIREYILQGDSDVTAIIKRYEEAVEKQAEDFTEETQNAYMKATAAMDAANAWDFEQRMEQILGKLDINDLSRSIATLSGGEKKRVALAFVLIDNPDLIILDEPTNHLDLDMIEWLESYLIKSNVTLLMVTHDRYFLDRVCNHILEIDAGYLYHHNGNYAYYLQKKAEREAQEQAELHKAGQLYKKELDWMRRQPKARTSKSKSRIDAFYQTEKKANSGGDDAELELDVSSRRIGGQVLELEKISKSYGDLTILDEFSYSFNKGERIGIIGKNGVGKSTFLKIITGEEDPDSGDINTGATIEFGHYRQQEINFDENLRPIEVVKEVASVIELSDGKQISASQFLEHFMFPGKLQYTPVHKLSGGEKRRLALMMVLIKNPNFLILDEPTNDLDLMTLQKLEEFLVNFGGCLIVVSHDRFFMDKLVQHYFVFEGDGVIHDHHGTYMEYREFREQREAEQRKIEREKKKTVKPKTKPAAPKKKESKLSYKEQKELKKLEKQLHALEKDKSELEEKMGGGTLEGDELRDASIRYGELSDQIDEKTMEWLELADKDSD
ncbi:ABC transporter ATP-binding protein [Rhodohalobacter sp. SW132]|uniref:ABC-F family ATP-binding cassette domain-containing protein n=1 Tax=Rhodohalobacter sp. SW132 TaxID=2293433 RepID=UPI000E222089|nr:ABC-F family ATP-binding cassette domain-containing protein [Rhodohalobacter sp. SW132]REL39010.1 ABC transporter ATP-binding protein [Rhodohalobacter sp. SW132]